MHGNLLESARPLHLIRKNDNRRRQPHSAISVIEIITPGAKLGDAYALV